MSTVSYDTCRKSVVNFYQRTTFLNSQRMTIYYIIYRWLVRTYPFKVPQKFPRVDSKIRAVNIPSLTVTNSSKLLITPPFSTKQGGRPRNGAEIVGFSFCPRTDTSICPAPTSSAASWRLTTRGRLQLDGSLYHADADPRSILADSRRFCGWTRIDDVFSELQRGLSPAAIYLAVADLWICSALPRAPFLEGNWT